MSSNKFKFFTFGIFLFLLSTLRLLDHDLIGFYLFLFLSLLFIFSFMLEKKRISMQDKADERKKLFSTIASPRITSRQEGNSQITTLIVPSLELFNEINDRNI